jgi:hypothetical protein
MTVPTSSDLSSTKGSIRRGSGSVWPSRVPARAVLSRRAIDFGSMELGTTYWPGPLDVAGHFVVANSCNATPSLRTRQRAAFDRSRSIGGMEAINRCGGEGKAVIALAGTAG